MASFLHRTTKVYQPSASPNGLPEPIENYIQDPDVSAVAGHPTKYWTIAGDLVTLMSASEMQAVDDDAAAEMIAANRTDAAEVPDNVEDAEGWENRALIELLNNRDNYLIDRIMELQAQVQAMLDSTGGVENMRTEGLTVSISVTATRDRTAAIADYKANIASGGVDI